MLIQVGQARSELPQIARTTDIIAPIPPSKNTQVSRFKTPSFCGRGEGVPLTQKLAVRSTIHANTLGRSSAGSRTLGPHAPRSAVGQSAGGFRPEGQKAGRGYQIGPCDPGLRLVPDQATYWPLAQVWLEM